MDNVETILFDFDGTLADTIGVGVTTFNQLAERYGFIAITPDNAESLRMKGPRAAMKALEVPMLRVPTVLRSLRSGIKSALPMLHFMEGMRVAIVELKAKGYRLGIVTSNSEANVRNFLANNQIDMFDFVRAGTGLFNKSLKIRRLMAHEGWEKEKVVFVGDEIRDVEAAKKNGIMTVAVTWGLNSREGLASAGADFIVEDTKALLELF